MLFLGERPSIANPTERAMMNEGVEVIVVKKLRRKCAVWVSTPVKAINRLV
jgi:hypothetical protein